MDLAATAMCFADMYHWFGTGFGNIIALNDIFLSGFDTPMIGAFIAALVQGFYCFRLWTINKYTLPVCIVVILVSKSFIPKPNDIERVLTPIAWPCAGCRWYIRRRSGAY
jgi:hypothetical protein